MKKVHLYLTAFLDFYQGMHSFFPHIIKQASQTVIAHCGQTTVCNLFWRTTPPYRKVKANYST